MEGSGVKQGANMGAEEIYTHAFILGQVDTACYEVARGKPVSVQALRARQVDEAQAIAAAHGVYSHVEPNGAEGWVSFWIYRRPYLLDVIKGAPKSPRTPSEHWFMGKLFGYSDEDIERFIQCAVPPDSE
jgi:hypothetical protein